MMYFVVVTIQYDTIRYFNMQGVCFPCFELSGGHHLCKFTDEAISKKSGSKVTIKVVVNDCCCFVLL